MDTARTYKSEGELFLEKELQVELNVVLKYKFRTLTSRDEREVRSNFGARMI